MTTHHRIPWRIEFDSTGYSRPWAGLTPDWEPAIIHCRHDHDQPLCPDCTTTWIHVLSDIPALLHDLDLAITKGVRFVQHGQRKTSEARPDEAPVDFNPAAADARQRIIDALDQTAADLAGIHPGPPTAIAWQLRVQARRLAWRDDTPAHARTISTAVARAHRVIDAPKDLVYYGPCPTCGDEIWLERLREDDREPVTCPNPACAYRARLTAHQLQQLDLNHEKLMTVSELVSAITSAGETVTRDQINGWIRRGRLATHTMSRPRFYDGQIHSEQITTCRLGDVRALALEAEERRATHRADRRTNDDNQ